MQLRQWKRPGLWNKNMVSPCKRMNLGKKVAPTGSHRLGVLPPGAYRAGRANWDSQMTRLFLQLAIKEIEAEGRGTTQLSNNSLRNIAAELSARTGEVITLKQCKNRYGVLKRDWQAWILLADSRRGATGLGWNPITGTFTAPDHFWANLIAVNKFSSWRWFMCVILNQSAPKLCWNLHFLQTSTAFAVYRMKLHCHDGFTADKLKPMIHQHETHEYLDRRDFYKPFKGNCIGAIDGTHVMIRCKKKEDEKRFFSWKGYATQNIMAICDFDLTFVFASTGREGIYHDYNIFKRCVLNPRYRFPQPEPGKYYLVDAGYPNRPGFLAPYIGFRYHQAEFRRGQQQPRDDREHFNKAHSSLRSIIERTFGVWKNRFGFLALMPWYEMSTQVDLVLASMAIHNYIRRDRVPDNFSAPVSSAYEYAFEDLPDEDPELEDTLDERDDIVDRDNVPEMNDVRNNIRRALRRLRRRGDRAA